MPSVRSTTPCRSRPFSSSVRALNYVSRAGKGTKRQQSHVTCRHSGADAPPALVAALVAALATALPLLYHRLIWRLAWPLLWPRFIW